MDITEYLRKRYEEASNEPWADLEKRVRDRHKDFCALLDSEKNFDRIPSKG